MNRTSAVSCPPGFGPVERVHPAPRLAVLALVVLTQSWGLRAAPAAGPTPLRFGFAAETLSGVNESDARAALKVWAQTVGTERGIPVDPLMSIYPDTAALGGALRQEQVDAVTLSTEQYWQLRREIPFSALVLGKIQGKFTEEYVLLVRRDGPVVRLADLRGRSVNIHQGPRGNLGALWIETLLLEARQGRADAFWGKVTRSAKTASVVLPVFFKQADACIVTRNGFDTMNELNPQVGRQLKILAESPPLVPTVFCFRASLVSPYRDKLVAEIDQISKSVAGRQSLALFQSEQLTEQPLAMLDETCALLDRHHELRAAAGPVSADEGVAK